MRVSRLSFKLPSLSILTVLLVQAVMANPVTVYDNGVVSGAAIINVNLTWSVSPDYPGGYSGSVYAGLEKLTVGNVNINTLGFCIDLYHLSAHGGPLQYTSDPLASSPTAVPPGDMGAEKAAFISQLWAKYFSPTMNASDAAALQVAIWSLLVPFPDASVSAGQATGNFSWLNTSDGVTAIIASEAKNYIDAINAVNQTGSAPVADLCGLNPVGYGQAFVIDAVPDGGMTAILLGMGVVCLSIIRLRFVKD